MDDNEFAQLLNPNATARMRYESRVIALGNLWGPASSGACVNVWSTKLHNYLADWWTWTWEKSGQKGAYNDNLLQLTGQYIFAVTQGGHIIEFDGRINGNSIGIPFMKGYANILLAIAQRSPSNIVAGNIGTDNLFRATGSTTAIFLDAITFYLRESFYTAGFGTTGYYGIQKTWDNFVLSAMGKQTLIQGMLWQGAVDLVDRKSQANWERDIMTVLSLYYFYHVPNLTSFNSWGNGWSYGSSNTDDYHYYRTGVPKNVAYQPTKMMMADIGVPIASKNEMSNQGVGREFLAWQTATSQDSYIVIGDSSMSTVYNAELLPT